MGMPAWLAALDHGGLEVVLADIWARAVGTEMTWLVFSGSSPRHLDGFGATSVVGPGGLRCALVVPWWHYGMCLSHLSGNGVAEASGSMLLLLVRECATGTLMIRTKVFISTLAGDSGGGALGASFFP